MVIQIQQRGFGVGGRYGRAGIQVGRQQQRPQEMRISRFIRSPASFLGKNCFVKLIQRCKFFLVYEIELLGRLGVSPLFGGRAMPCTSWMKRKKCL